jgi:hypothetical protein
LLKPGQIGVLIRDAGDHQPFQVQFEGNTHWYRRSELELADDDARDSSGPAPLIEPWRDHSGVDLSNLSATGQVRFKGGFATVRGPAFNRSESEAFFEIRVLQAGPIPQFGFCTSDFTKTPGRTDQGCGDDEHSWGWDGRRNSFWQNSFNGRHESPQISWSEGDTLQFKVDFKCNKTYFSKNGQRIHEHAFSAGIMTLYPCITAKDDVILVSVNRPIPVAPAAKDVERSVPQTYTLPPQTYSPPPSSLLRPQPTYPGQAGALIQGKQEPLRPTPFQPTYPGQIKQEPLRPTPLYLYDSEETFGGV